MPRVSFGIAPGEANQVPDYNFAMFDNRMAMVENVTAELTITRPRELATCGRAFDVLAKRSVTGSAARELLMEAIARRSADR